MGSLLEPTVDDTSQARGIRHMEIQSSQKVSAYLHLGGHVCADYITTRSGQAHRNMLLACMSHLAAVKWKCSMIDIHTKGVLQLVLYCSQQPLCLILAVDIG